MNPTIAQLANLAAAAAAYFVGGGDAAAAVADVFQAPLTQIQTAAAAVAAPDVRAAAALLDSESTAGRDADIVRAEIVLRAALGTRCALQRRKGVA